jgi:hypothetical protein
MRIKKWLERISWEMVVWQNEQLCQSKRAHHGPTSDGYDVCKQLWESNQNNEITLFELVDFCRHCHRLAPFTNYNGNTFAAIIRALIDQLDLSAPQSALGRSLAGHIVAGVAGEDELKAFEEFCNSLG